MDRLKYFTLHHPLTDLQKQLTRAEAERDRKNLLSKPECHTFLHKIKDLGKRLKAVEDDEPETDPSELEIEELDGPEGEQQPTTAGQRPTPPVVDPHIKVTRLEVKDVLLAIVSSLESMAGRAILGLPRTNRASRMPSEMFRLALTRKLRLPIQRKPTKCKCG